VARGGGKNFSRKKCQKKGRKNHVEERSTSVSVLKGKGKQIKRKDSSCPGGRPFKHFAKKKYDHVNVRLRRDIRRGLNRDKRASLRKVNLEGLRQKKSNKRGHKRGGGPFFNFKSHEGKN